MPSASVTAGSVVPIFREQIARGGPVTETALPYIMLSRGILLALVIGFLFLGAVTGIGGGTARDLVLGVPVFWVEQPLYVLVCAATAVIVYFTAHLIESRYRLLLWLDAVALSAYGVFGAYKGFMVTGSVTVAVVMGMITERMLGLEGDAQVRSDDTGHPVNRAFADLKFEGPRIECEPGFEGQLHAINLFDHIARADVTWNPSFTSITKACICCVTSEEHMLPVIHGNDRNEWFIQLTDEIHWNIADKNTGAPRGRVVMRAGDVCAMPADIRHQGFAPKRAMLMVMENGTPGLEKRYASGELKPYPVDFG